MWCQSIFIKKKTPRNSLAASLQTKHSREITTTNTSSILWLKPYIHHPYVYVSTSWCKGTRLPPSSPCCPYPCFSFANPTENMTRSFGVPGIHKWRKQTELAMYPDKPTNQSIDWSIKLNFQLFNYSKKQSNHPLAKTKTHKKKITTPERSAWAAEGAWWPIFAGRKGQERPVPW